jgi:hypothetical protein
LSGNARFENPISPRSPKSVGDAPSGPILGVRVADLEMKEVVLASDPLVYFTIPHFDGYPALLVRLPKIKGKALKEIIVEAWLARAPKRAVEAYLARHKA